jgi:hypothetical protein
MSAEIIHLKIFHPRTPRDADTELSINADISLLEKIERFTALQKNICTRQSTPLPPAVRLMVMEAMDALEL